MGVIYQRFYSHITNIAFDTCFFKPLKVEIALTNSCNQRCRHCSNSARLNKNATFFDIHFLKDILSCNPLIVILTGGEPLLHPKLLDIIKTVKNSGTYIRILSNGTLLSDSFLSKLKEAGWSKDDIIQISLDAVDDKVYESQRGKDDLEIVKKSIKNTVDHGIQVDIHTVPTKLNIDQIEDIYTLVNQLGVAYYSGGPLAPLYPELLNLMCNTEKTNEIHKRLISLSHKNKTIYTGGIEGDICSNYELLKKNFDFRRSKQAIYRCSAGRYSCYINEAGLVFPCVYLSEKRNLCGNLYNNSLEDIWRSKSMNIYKQGFLIENTKCAKCKFWGLCNGGCLGVSSVYSNGIRPGNDPRCFMHCSTNK